MDTPATSSPSPDLAEAILEQCADALIYADREGKIRRWNAAAQALFGFSQEQALGQSLDLIIPEHLRAGHWRGFQAAMATGALRLHGQATLTRSLHASGAKCYVEMSFAVVRDAQGQPIGSVAMARDATAKVEREKAAKAEKAAGTAG